MVLDFLPSPDRHFLKKLPFARKFLVVGFLFLLPIALLLSSLITRQMEDIERTKIERKGLHLIVPLRQVVQALQVHRGASQLIAAQDKLDEARHRVEKSIAFIESLDERSALHASWKELKSQANAASPEESFARHTALIADILVRIVNIADKTGLSLDPHVETSQLARALYDDLLNATESAGAMRAIGSRVLTRQALNETERTQLRLFLSNYEQSMNRAHASFNKAVTTNTALKNSIQDPFNYLYLTKFVYASEARHLLTIKTPTGDPHIWFDAATRAIDAVFSLWDIAIEQMDDRLFQRSEALTRALFLSITLTLLAVILAIYFAITFTRSLTHAIREKAAIEASVQSGLHLRTILDSLGEGVYVLDNDGKLTYLNTTGEQLLGWTFKELKGRPVHDIIHHHTPDGRALPAEHCPIHLAMHNDRIYRSDDEVFFAKDGTPLPVAVTGAPLLLDDNRIGSVAAFRDMRAQHDLIEKMAVAQDKLFDAKEKALEGARTKSEFLSMMSHEIRTPLNGVIGMIDLLMDTHLDAEQQELTAISKDSAKQLLSVINDILDFSKIEAGKLDIEKLPFDFPLTVESSVDLVTTRAREKGLSLTCFIDPAIPTRLIGDPTRIRQILLNFLSNAIKFTESGEISVRATMEGSENIIKIVVMDSGIGMTPETLTRLFQPFSQADMSTTRKYGGTGLGLSITKRLAELMGGQVGATNRPGQGSDFWVTLNLPVHLPASPLPLDDLRGRRLVIAGGCPATREGLATYAGAWGLEVILQPTFDETALAQAHLLLLIDPLPSTTIEEILAHSALKKFPELLVCLMQPAPLRRTALLDRGVRSVLVSPVKQSTFFNALHGALHPVTPQSTSPQPLSVPSTGDRTLHILLAEDNAINQKVASRLLSKLGCHIDIANNGSEAVHLWQIGNYAFILMDVQMPEMDGFEATQAIRKIEAMENRRQRTPIIAMTANAMTGDRERCLAQGMDDYLSKPIDPLRLQAVLEAWHPSSAHEPLPAPAVLPESGVTEPKVTPIDMARLIEFFGSDKEAILELLHVFAESLPVILTRAKVSLHERNAAIKAAAHELKGASANIGAMTLAHLAAELEKTVVVSHWPEADELFKSIENEAQRITTFIQNWKH